MLLIHRHDGHTDGHLDRKTCQVKYYFRLLFHDKKQSFQNQFLDGIVNQCPVRAGNNSGRTPINFEANDLLIKELDYFEVCATHQMKLITRTLYIQNDYLSRPGCPISGI